jgi:hypothetical protein
MLFRPSRQRRIAGGKKDQMVQIGAGQTQRAFLFDQRDPGFGAEIFAALAADGFAIKTLTSSILFCCDAIVFLKGIDGACSACLATVNRRGSYSICSFG